MIYIIQTSFNVAVLISKEWYNKQAKKGKAQNVLEQKIILYGILDFTNRNWTIMQMGLCSV